MRTGAGDPSSLRWRLAAIATPEIVALALVIVLGAAIILIVTVGPLSGNGQEPTARPSPQPSGESRSVGAWATLGGRP